MRKVIVSFVAALAVVVLPQLLTAQEAGRPDRPRPDAKADRSAPKKTFPARSDGKFEAGKFEGRHEHANRDGVKSDGPMAYGFARAIFDRLDTNHDGVLSFEEFAAGLRQLRRILAVQLPNPVANRPSGDRYQQFAGKHFDGDRRPEGSGFAEGRPWRQESPGFAEGRPWVQEHRVVLEERTWRHEGREFSESWRHEYREYGESRPWQRDGREFGEGRQAHPADRVTASVSPRHNFDKAVVPPDARKPDMKKPECKKPEAKGPEVRGHGPKAPVAKAPAGDRSMEARVASLEKQQAEILSLLRNFVKSSPKDVRHDERRQDRRDRD